MDRAAGGPTRADARSVSRSPRDAPQEKNARLLGKPEGGLRLRIYTVIFEADTCAGRLFDLVLICAILASVVVVIVDSIETWSGYHSTLLFALEWMFTIVFTLEYAARLWCVQPRVPERGPPAGGSVLHALRRKAFAPRTELSTTSSRITEWAGYDFKTNFNHALNATSACRCDIWQRAL